MNILVRALIIWMLGLAVSFQGATAATMALCSPGRHTPAATTDAVSASNAMRSIVAQAAARFRYLPWSPLS